MESVDFVKTIADLESGLFNVDTIYNSKKSIQYRNELSNWNDDKKLSDSISNLKKATEITSNSMTKLTLISTKFPDQLASILKETYGSLNVLVNCYFDFTEANTCESLYNSTYHHLRPFLIHTKDLLFYLQNGIFIESKSGTLTGMVWKSAEAVGKLPVSNKQSFRRDWMECIGEIAETVREFEGYVSTSLTSDTGNDTIDEEKDEDDEDDDDDEFNEEVRYSMDEIPLVQKALTLMTHSLATTKLGLQVLTVIGDALNKIISVDNIDLEVALRSLSIQSTDSEGKSPTVDSISGVCTSASEGIYTSSGSLIERLTADRSGLMVWIGEMVRVRKHLLDALTDLGCELYTPIDAVDVNKLYIVTLHYSKLLLGLLMHPPFQSFLSEEVKTKLTETNVQLHAVST